jgi:hypothetical protein
MKKFDHHVNKSLDFRDLTAWELQAACLYEHMRESRMLRGALTAATEDERKEKAFGLSPFLLRFSEERFFRLMVALQDAGFPKPWQGLSKASRAQLVSLLAKSTGHAEDKKLYPPIIIEQGAAEFDLSENCWRVGQLEPFELSLFKAWEHSGRAYFFGFIRIDAGYNETEAVEAFRTEFRKHWPKTKGGGRAKWRDRLNQLAVMRIWKRERDQWKRLKMVAEFCGYKDCIREAAAYKKRCKEGRGDEPMSRAAKIEMSSARSEARKIFQSLFPGQEPLNH